MVKGIGRVIIACGALTSIQAAAISEQDQCILTAIQNSSGSETVDQIKARCQMEASVEGAPVKRSGILSQRIAAEREIQRNRFAIIPHKQNYILPVTHTSKINREAYKFAGESNADELRQIEAKIQLSLKVALNDSDLFLENDGLYFGFTATSWWQLYASDISAPFRETNYQPELFYMAGLDWQPFGGNTGFTVGIEHQSNGRSQFLSRSWNRVYAELLFEKDNFAMSLRPWYRLREDDKDDPVIVDGVEIRDSEGDDNPDIEKYMGHFELFSAYRYKQHEFSFMGRNNLRSENKGAFELGWSFPLYGSLRGYVQYFNGYGESLIDYNISQERIGFGVLLTDLL